MRRVRSMSSGAAALLKASRLPAMHIPCTCHAYTVHVHCACACTMHIPCMQPHGLQPHGMSPSRRPATNGVRPATHGVAAWNALDAWSHRLWRSMRCRLLPATHGVAAWNDLVAWSPGLWLSLRLPPAPIGVGGEGGRLRTRTGRRRRSGPPPPPPPCHPSSGARRHGSCAGTTRPCTAPVRGEAQTCE